jgi:hypothetical protein
LRGRCHNYAKEWGSSSCSIKRTSISMRRITSNYIHENFPEVYPDRLIER